MKTIGRTTNRGDKNEFIILVPFEEYSAFVKLQATVNGNSYQFWDVDRIDLDGTDLSPVLDALEQMFRARANITVLRDAINELDKLLGSVDKEGEKE